MKKEPEPLAGGIEHLHGTLFRIRRTVINVADAPDPEAEPSEEYHWSNIRYLTHDHDGGDLGRGFGKADVVRLRDSIRDEGLYYPLLCRWVISGGERTVQLVDGERRFRNIDFLVKKNEKCFNPVTRQFEPATALYDVLVCNVFHAETDEECLKLAYKSGTCRVDFGDEADINIVREARRRKWTDNQILEITGQTPTWLKDIDKIISKLSGDQKTLSAFCAGVLLKSAALTLAEESDVEARHRALDECIKYATDDAVRKQGAISKKIQSAKETAEVAKAKKAEAEFTGDTEAAKAADAELQTAQKTVQEKTEERNSVTPRASGADARRAREQTGGTPTPPKSQALRAAKIKNLYVDVLDGAIKNLGNDADDVFLAPIEVLTAFRDISKAIMEGEEEPMKIFRKWGKRLIQKPE